MRMPDWLFTRVQRAYLAEKGIRDRELHERAWAEDMALRAWADRIRVAHRNGTCGGAAAGCMFTPCIPSVEDQS